MSDLQNLINKFKRLKSALDYDKVGYDNSDYLKDHILAQTIIVDLILNSNHIHGYSQKGLQLFLLNLDAEPYSDTSEISDSSFFRMSFNEFTQTLINEISFSRLAGFPIRFL